MLYSGRVRGWLEEPEEAPWDLQWIDPQRRWKGIYVEVLPLAVMVARKEDAWRVTESPSSIRLRMVKAAGN